MMQDTQSRSLGATWYYLSQLQKSEFPQLGQRNIKVFFLKSINENHMNTFMSIIYITHKINVFCQV